MISKAIVNRPVTTFIVFLLFVTTSFFTFSGLAVDLLPDISLPIVVVNTTWGDTAPEEVERSVTRLIEGVMGSLSGLEKISSISSKGNSQVVLEFTYGTNIDSAVNNIRDALDRVKAILPNKADAPSIFQFNPSQIPILQVIVSGENRTPEDLKGLAEDYIQPQIERIDGVAMTSLSGARGHIIKVTISQNRLNAYGLTLTQIAQVLSTQNLQVSGGLLNEGDVDFVVRTSGEFRSLEEVRNAVIDYKGSSGQHIDPLAINSLVHTIRLRDIANVEDTLTQEKSVVYFNGVPAVAISVQKQSGSNSVQVADRIIKLLDEINYVLPEGVKAQPLRDTTVYIRNSLAEVVSSGLTGGALAVLILFIFLRNLRSTLIISLSIPIAFFITLMGMSFLGLSLNIMTLTGLALGVGMLVDNAIVILENIYQYREKGVKLKPSAILGTQEMIKPIVSSTITTICVFLPIILFKSHLKIQGEILGDLAFTVVVSILSSLLVAMFLVPILCSHFLPIRTRKERPLKGFLATLDKRFALFFLRLDEAYRNSVLWALNHKKRLLSAILVLFFASFFLLKWIGFVLMPSWGDDAVSVSVKLPVGSSLNLTRSVLFQLEDIVKNEIVYKDISIKVGSGGGLGKGQSGSSHQGELTIILPPLEKRVDSYETIKKKLRAHFKDFPSDIVFSFGRGASGGGMLEPIDIIVSSNNLNLIESTALAVYEMLKDDFVDKLGDVSIDLPDPLPEIDIIVNRERLYSLGLNISSIGQEVRASLEGVKTATKFRFGGQERDIIISLSDKDKEHARDLGKIFVVNNRGERVSLDNVARTVVTTGPTSILRENQARCVHIKARTLPGVELTQVTAEVKQALLEKIPVSEDLSVRLSGEYEETMKQFSYFAVILIVAIMLIFGTMAAQFESFLDPFLILFTIPLTFIGVLVVYYLTANPLSVFTAMGIVMLAGIVVNNGIVLIEYIRLLRFRGMSVEKAIIEAARSRLRPILMTSLTTILGLLPLAFSQGESGSLVQPIGLTILGGLTTASFLTLYMVPCLYQVFHCSIPRRWQSIKKRYNLF